MQLFNFYKFRHIGENTEPVDALKTQNNKTSIAKIKERPSFKKRLFLRVRLK